MRYFDTNMNLSQEDILIRRSARATLIEDGNNETLARHGGHILMESYPRGPLDF